MVVPPSEVTSPPPRAETAVIIEIGVVETFASDTVGPEVL